MHVKNKIGLYIILLSLMVTHNLFTRVRTINTRRDFEKTIMKSSRVIVFFYNEKNNKKLYKYLMRMYEDVSDYKPYDDGDVVFLKINTARKDLSDLALLYEVRMVPSFIFFNKGKRLLNDQLGPLVLTGNITRNDLHNVIDQYYSDTIKEYIEQKNNKKRAELASESEVWKAYFYPRNIFIKGYEPAKRDLE